jgi:hypothetical protein
MSNGNGEDHHSWQQGGVTARTQDVKISHEYDDYAQASMMDGGEEGEEYGQQQQDEQTTGSGGDYKQEEALLEGQSRLQVLESRYYSSSTMTMPLRQIHPDDCKDWSVADVVEWVSEFIADPRLVQILETECIDGPALISYTVQEMKEDGFPRGVAKQLQAAIHKLVHVRVTQVERSVRDLEHLVRMMKNEMVTIRAALHLDARAKEFLWHPRLRNPLLLPMANGRVVFDCGLRDRDNTDAVGTWKTILGDVVWTKGCHYYEVLLGRCASGSLLIGAVPESYSKFEWGISSRSPGISWYPYFQKPDNLRIKSCKQNSYGYVKDMTVTAGARLGVKIDMDKQLVQFFRDGVRAAEPLYVPIALSAPIRPAISMYYPLDSVSTLFESQLSAHKLVFMAGVQKHQGDDCELFNVLGRSKIKDPNVMTVIFQFFDVFQSPCEF